MPFAASPPAAPLRTSPHDPTRSPITMADEQIAAVGDRSDCCPVLEDCAPCDTLDFRFRLPFRALAEQRGVQVEVTMHFRLSRCAGPLSLGDILYSTTLLPGEKVRLFTSDRHSRFSFDS